jgi:hypothetical protein
MKVYTPELPNFENNSVNTLRWLWKGVNTGVNTGVIIV